MQSKHLQEAIRDYLSTLLGESVRIDSILELGKKEPDDLKSFGYGKPYRIVFTCRQGTRSVVLETMSENSFGHDHFSDRAQNLLWAHSVFNRLPRHGRSLDAGAFTSDNRILSAGKAQEFFLLTEFVEGKEYNADLERILASGTAGPLDFRRAESLAGYLAEIHRVRHQSPSLYSRRIRELVGHGECVMGLIDNYPDNDTIFSPAQLQRIEQAFLRWRWKLRPFHHRLSQVHGDFHPWNILFREGTDFTVLDRSRGEWGEPADDTGSISMNFLFFALRHCGSPTGPFREIYQTFWNTYLQSSQDQEMAKVLPPFLAWRALVMANPIWYPRLTREIRVELLHFIHCALSLDELPPHRIEECFG